MRRLAALLALVATSACATIMHGTRQDVGISSTPTSAKVTVDNAPLGSTPIVANLKRGDNHIVRVEMPGYQPFEATLTKKTSGWVWGNIVFGGLVGLAVDAITGGLYSLTPEQVSAVMVKQNASNTRGTLQVFVVLQPHPAWTKVGQLARE
jgi:hypothetical protein